MQARLNHHATNRSHREDATIHPQCTWKRPRSFPHAENESKSASDEPRPVGNVFGASQPESSFEEVAGNAGNPVPYAPQPGPATFTPNDTTVSQYPATEPVPVNEKDLLQSQYVKLAMQRAELMTVEELKTAIATSEAETNEVSARRQLEEAREILSRLLEQHPDSKAAG